ncbi:MAG: 2Fe-2S iron-sulfur cluster-binding protein [Sulfurimonas sp.]|jgi:fumarate reductase iron-sulfur subunit|nr:2Fe-2S iron-sulfur cluster-binding protein [Sulfurimonadaceae bacterium]
MKLSIKKDSGFIEFYSSSKTLLEALDDIKTTKDNSLCYSSGCRSGVCGSCAVRVNGVEVLACSYELKDGDVVEPLKNTQTIRDLVVVAPLEFNAKAKAYLCEKEQKPIITKEQTLINELQSECILCASCFSICPVYELNPNFLGPFALTRVWRYVSDVREDEAKSKIDLIQQDGIWDCTLCNACTTVCPQGISSKADIEKLRAKSAMFGYSDPSFSSFGFGSSFDGSPVF